MKCFCSSSFMDCPPEGQLECDKGVSHCILSMRYDNTTNRFVESLLDCWRWLDASRCPTEPGACNILKQSQNNFQSCCCKGNLCNNSSALQMVELSDSQWANTSVLTTINEKEPVQNHDSFLLLLLIPILVCVFFLVLGILLCQLNQRRMKAVLFKQALPSSRANRLCTCEAMRLKADGAPGSSIAQCTCGYLDRLKQNGELDSTFGYHPGLVRRAPNVGTDWMTLDEIEGLASKITKLELKSQGCFGQVWHGRLVLPIENSVTGGGSDPTRSAIKTEPSTESGSANSGEPLLDMTKTVDVAVKIFRSTQKESWQTELSLFRLPGLAHPNILKFYGADQVNDYNGPIPDVQYWLVTEYHPLGSLYDYLRSNTISWIELLQVAISVARGLTHLHAETTLANGTDATVGHPKLSVAHRDLNSRNVLLKSDMTACIADFGLAIRFDPGQFPSVAHPQLGTRRYMAPEVLDGAIQFSRDAYLRIDVYAMGLVFWELMSRCTGTTKHPIAVTEPYRAPFELELGPGPTMEELQLFVAHEKQRPKFNPAWTVDANMCTLWETVEECWDQDAEARLSAGCVTKRLATLNQQAQIGWDTSCTPLVALRPRLTLGCDDQPTGIVSHDDPSDRDRIGLASQRTPAVFGPRSLGRPQPTLNAIHLPVPSKCASDAVSSSGHLNVPLLNGN